MRTTTIISALLLVLSLSASLQAGPRASANYTVPTDAADAGGKHATSANYTNEGSLGGMTGISTVAAPAETAKAGYIGQLYEVAGLTLNVVSPNVNEGATDQLAAWQSLDDGTFLAVNATDVTWSVAGGPLTGISASGVATAGSVYQDSPAIAQGAYLGQTATLGLTVLNTNTDDFGAYAGDGIDDSWQVQYFGQPPNANAGPLVDADGTGQTNYFKYIAGLNPTDPSSVFRLRIEAVPGQSGQMKAIFSPRLDGRTYVVKASSNLTTGGYTALGSFSTADNGQERAVTDFGATGATKFYKVEITKP